MKKRVLALIAAVTLLTGVMSGCGDKGNNLNADGKLELTIMGFLTENAGSESQIQDKMYEMTNVQANLIQAPQASYGEKLNTTLASGNLPDIVYMYEDQMNLWIEEGALLPLDDLIEKYAPNFMKNLREGDEKQLVYPEDGKIYGLPYMLRLPAQRTMGVRKDWLDKLGLKAPDTIEELEKVLTAFKDNASKLSDSAIIPYVGLIGPFYGLFDIQQSGDQNMWTENKDGKLVTYFEHDNYRQCLELLNRFYENGLIDPEFMTRNNDEASVYNLFNAGTAGMGFVYSTRLSEITGNLQTEDKNALFDFMPPVTGISGQKKIDGRDVFGIRGCITIAAEDKVKECLGFLDWAYSEEGERLLNYGIEGQHYDMVDGKPVIRPEFNQGWVDIRKEGIVPTNMSYNRSLDAYNQCMFYGKDISELSELEKLTYKAYYENENYVVPKLKAMRTELSAKKGTDIYANLKEKEAKAILGTISIDEFFEELAKAKANGLDDLTKEMDAAWQKFNK